MKKTTLFTFLLSIFLAVPALAQTIVSGYVEKSSTGSILGVTATLSGTVAALPAAGVPGRLYFPTDGVYLYRDNGASWDAYLDGSMRVYPLDTSSWSWDNQGTATVSTAIGTTVLTAPAGIGDFLHLRYKTAPATPFTLTMLYEAASAKGLGTVNGIIGCRENATGKVKMLQVGQSSGFAVIVQHFTTAAGPWNSNRVSTPVGVWTTPLPRQWLRFEDNGTNNIYSVSRDGRTWQVIGSESRTANFTCDQIHVGVQAESSSDDWDQAVTILSYQEQ